MKNRDEKMENELKKILGYIFILTVLLLLILNFFKKDIEFSFSENRILEKRPKITMDSIINGRFMTKYEKYQTDQFVFRDKWVKLKTITERVFGKTKSNGVYLGKNGYLLEDISVPKEGFEKNLKAINSFTLKYSNLNNYMIIVPNASNILYEYLPAFAPVVDQNKQMNEIKKSLEGSLNYIDITDTMKEHKNEYLYYRTDHHWTTKGAYYSFLEAAKHMKLETINEYKEYPVTNQFEGTLLSKSGYDTKKDTISIFLNESEEKENIIVKYVEEKQVSTSVYKSDNLKEKDKYTIFFDGNHPIVEIKTLSKYQRKLLVFKDSFANCFVPFLTPYFREIVMIDPRYYYGNLKELMDSKQFTDVLFLYNANTFFEDNSLYSVLEDAL